MKKFIFFTLIFISIALTICMAEDTLPNTVRFVDNKDGTITDSLTGLMWERVPTSKEMYWHNAMDYCDKLELAGYSDWRPPEIEELESLIKKGSKDSGSWLNTQGFSNVQSNYYWSATDYAPRTAYAWYVCMYSGNVDYGGKARSYRVWAVRAGQ